MGTHNKVSGTSVDEAMHAHRTPGPATGLREREHPGFQVSLGASA